jgi:hypothetical protein
MFVSEKGTNLKHEAGLGGPYPLGGREPPWEIEMWGILNRKSWKDILEEKFI